MINYRCEHCGVGIADEAGGIAVSYTEIFEYQRAKAEFDDAHRDENGAVVISGRAFAELPEPAHWHTGHWACLPAELANPYEIAAENIRTYRAVGEWVAHLLGKTWIQDTDFDDWLRSHVL